MSNDKEQRTYLVVMLGLREYIAEDKELVSIKEVQANTFEEAEQMIKDQIIDEYGSFTCWDDYGWRSIAIYEMLSKKDVEVRKRLSKEREERQRKNAEVEEAKERAEYQRLKKKYEEKQ